MPILTTLRRPVAGFLPPCCCQLQTLSARWIIHERANLNFYRRSCIQNKKSSRHFGIVWIENRRSPMLRRGAQPIFGRRATPSPGSPPLGEGSRPTLKRSHQVTLVLLGSTALVGWQYSRTAPPSHQPQQVVESSAQPGCDRGGSSASPGCSDGRSPAQDPIGRSTGTSLSGGHGGFFGFFHGGASSGASRASATTGVTTFGGFGGSGRAVAAHGVGG